MFLYGAGHRFMAIRGKSENVALQGNTIGPHISKNPSKFKTREGNRILLQTTIANSNNFVPFPKWRLKKRCSGF